MIAEKILSVAAVLDSLMGSVAPLARDTLASARRELADAAEQAGNLEGSLTAISELPSQGGQTTGERA